VKSTPLILAFGAITALPTLGFAYCRTTTCAQQNPPVQCSAEGAVTGCQTVGTKLFWPRACMSFSVQRDGSKQAGNPITADQLQSIVRASFDNWQGTLAGEEWDCPDDVRKPNLSVVTYPQVACNETRYNKDAPNQNVWLFRDDSWPHEGGGDRTIALTLVSFNPTTGEIYDVDVELNSYAQDFTIQDGAIGGTDLQSVVQHESGHFLGLAHATQSSSTMWANYNGSSEMRTLSVDDQAGICEIFPPTDTPDPSCNPAPRHGFSTKCEDKDSGCSIASVGNATGGGAMCFAFVSTGLLLLRSRTTGRGRRRARHGR
jgi:hypothetical protein